MAFRCPLTILLLSIGAISVGCAPKPPQQPNSETIKVADSTNSEKALAAQQRGVTHLLVGQLPQAQAAFEEAISLDPACGPAHNNLGKVFLLQNQLYQAAWEFENACKLMPTRAEPENNLGMVFEKAGKIDKAIGHFAKAHELAPDNFEILGNLARAHVRRGDRDAATRELLTELVMRETRPDWLAWAKEKLALISGVQTEPLRRNTLPQPESDNIFTIPKWEN